MTQDLPREESNDRKLQARSGSRQEDLNKDFIIKAKSKSILNQNLVFIKSAILVENCRHSNSQE